MASAIIRRNVARALTGSEPPSSAMNETLKAIARLVEEGSPELKVAAAQILGELQPQESALVQVLTSQLTYGDNVLNRYILQALSRIGSEEAVATLVSRLRGGGPELINFQNVCH